MKLVRRLLESRHLTPATLEELQALTDALITKKMQCLRCPATGKSVYDSLQEERVAMYLRLFSLPPGKTLETFDFSFQPDLSRAKIETLSTCEYVRRTENVIFLDPPGVGKTHLAASLGLKTIKYSYRVLFKRLDDPDTDAERRCRPPTRTHRRRRYYRVSVVIIGEMGFQPLSPKEAEPTVMSSTS